MKSVRILARGPTDWESARRLTAVECAELYKTEMTFDVVFVDAGGAEKTWRQVESRPYSAHVLLIDVSQLFSDLAGLNFAAISGKRSKLATAKRRMAETRQSVAEKANALATLVASPPDPPENPVVAEWVLRAEEGSPEWCADWASGLAGEPPEAGLLKSLLFLADKALKESRTSLWPTIGEGLELGRQVETIFMVSSLWCRSARSAFDDSLTYERCVSARLEETLAYFREYGEIGWSAVSYYHWTLTNLFENSRAHCKENVEPKRRLFRTSPSSPPPPSSGAPRAWRNTLR